jgi:predicted aminopeptidase
MRLLFVLALSAATPGCYYMQAAAGQWSVLRKSEPISEVIADSDTSDVLANRLRLLQEARRFSVDELGLPDNKSYRTYADIEREFVIWNVFAAPEFSLRPKQWCFPVAGCVSYRGYFSKDAAENESKRLAKRGYDVAVGGVTAYSTLGRFNDPVLSSMMRWDDVELVGVLFHELAHQVLYVKGDTAFNESFATAVEEFGLERWLDANGQSDEMSEYHRRREFRQLLMTLVAATRDDLRGYFNSDIDDDEKRRLKAARLERLGADIRAEMRRVGRDPTNWASGELNNARLLPLTLYEGRLTSFRALLAQCGQDIRCFYDKAESLSKLDRASRDERLDALAGS